MSEVWFIKQRRSRNRLHCNIIKSINSLPTSKFWTGWTKICSDSTRSLDCTECRHCSYRIIFFSDRNIWNLVAEYSPISSSASLDRSSRGHIVSTDLSATKLWGLLITTGFDSEVAAGWIESQSDSQTGCWNLVKDQFPTNVLTTL